MVEITIRFDKNNAEVVVWGVGPETAVGAVRDALSGAYDSDGRKVIGISINPASEERI